MYVKALQKMYYQRREYAPGETYEMDDRESMEADLLARLGKIEVIKDSYRTAQVKPEEEPDQPTEDQSEGESQPDKKRSYRRRDMRSEK